MLYNFPSGLYFDLPRKNGRAICVVVFFVVAVALFRHAAAGLTKIEERKMCMSQRRGV